MEKINRNDQCPCGSGKKYKKCCGANEAISINQIIEKEMDELQKLVTHFAFYQFESELEDDFADFEEFFSFEDEEERQFYEIIHAIWFSLFVQLEDGETIIEKYIQAEARKIKRPKLRQILQTWADARTIVGKIISVDDYKMKVEDGLTKEQLDVVITEDPIIIEEGSFFTGILVPYEHQYLFFPQPFDLPELEPEVGISFIKDGSLKAGFDSPQEYLTQFFMEILSELPMVNGVIELDKIEWPASIYKEVVDIYKAKLESLDFPPPVVDAGIALWYSFCQKKQKRIQKPQIYAAALHYLLLLIIPIEQSFTFKDLATLYGVSARSISPIVSELESELALEIAQIAGAFQDVEEEEEPFVVKGTVVEFPKGRARNLTDMD
ncbi:SEC-C domain-containing protein [Bacillus sp. BRMEA1]|uniref:YecA family protein n=1 Tax=Neobacillus endophyticus TaxID=2738405 RepID=UPI001564C326|nr:SEC-C metal-binding domain-containing protein [Neobacillus endophyticus]NRD76671.1 SEC-C domain-containing protein [Neobacillus endophyticus]